VRDWFAYFGLPRRPRVDVALLKENYLRLAALQHPDASGGKTSEFQETLEAYRLLSEPASRLRYLLELETGHPAPSSASLGDGDLFMRVGSALQKAKSLLLRLEGARTPLAKALLAGERALAIGEVRKAGDQIAAEEERLNESLVALDARWPAVEAVEVGNWCGTWTFVSRWKEELSEIGFRLAHA